MKDTSTTRDAFEVRCPACQVTFPRETKTCVHCGGRTSAVDAFVFADPVTQFETFDGFESPTMPSSSTSARTDGAQAGPAAIAADGESPFSIDPLGDSPFGGRSNDSVSGEDEDAPQSMGRQLMRSLGGVIWIAILIAFSLARSCGE